MLLKLLSGAVLFLLPIASFLVAPQASGQNWKIKPAYETNYSAGASRPFSIVDDTGVEHVLYDDSNAILIIEGAYSSGGVWPPVTKPARENERLLRDNLENRGFRVHIWDDLGSADLKTVLDDVFSTLGYKQNSRLFFYYYGHGDLIQDDSDSVGSRTFLVPIDAPDPAKHEEDFYRRAIPITQLLEYAREITVKHAFFALEACRAGSIILSLGGLEPPNPKGYLLSKKLQQPVRYFLTAGSADEDVAANNIFTPLFIGALSLGDSNHDGYVTGSEVINYVTQTIPQYTQSQTPEHGSIPISGGGDIVFGRADPESPQPKPPAPNVVKTVVTTKQWALPGLNVGCNETKSGRVEASVNIDSRVDRVLSVSANLTDVNNIKDQSAPIIVGPVGPSVVVQYSFGGLDRDFIGNCPGGGHATLTVNFVVEERVEEPPRQ
jgi:hypothetical protein